MERYNVDELGPGVSDIAPQKDRLIESIREFWDTFVYDDVRATEHPVGTKEFYADLEAHRAERLDYLPRVVDFGGYKDKRVLEVGCRIGLDLARFAKNGAAVTGIDLAQSCIETAHHYFGLNDLQGDLLVMNGEDMQFEDESFDLVYAYGVVQYTSNPKRMVQEIRRVLRVGGDAVFMAYNRYSWLTVLSRLSGKNLAHEDAPAFQPYSIGQFNRLLDDFSQVDIRAERFPTGTRLHKGLAARLYYTFFVGGFNLLPRSWVQPFGAHLIAQARR
jgi:2-polyprenyl-3-methyl-5-hydroxy-6-metoxy-1,4-benzoquinol methylase